MGAVYRAHDALLGRDVAVKVPSGAVAGDAAAGRRFRREAVSAARVHHPNVAVVHDVGEHAGRSFIVMELVPGGTVADRVAAGRPPRATALAWIAQAAAGLDAAHAAGVVHRDVKPANLLLDAAGRVKVADFGIARVLGDEGATLTAAGTVVGTSGYASPEQAQGTAVTPASDVYSLAAVAFELLTGERPYAPRTGLAELAAHVSAPVPRARDRDPALPPAVDEVLARGLAKDPAARFPSAGALAAALGAAFGDPGRTTAVLPAAAPPRPRRPRARTVAAAAAVAAVAGGVAIAATTMGGDRDGNAPPAEPVPPARTVVRTITQAATVTAPAPAPGPGKGEAKGKAKGKGKPKGKGKGKGPKG
jgi:serine/threonine-protein kinase